MIAQVRSTHFTTFNKLTKIYLFIFCWYYITNAGHLLWYFNKFNFIYIIIILFSFGHKAISATFCIQKVSKNTISSHFRNLIFLFVCSFRRLLYTIFCLFVLRWNTYLLSRSCDWPVLSKWRYFRLAIYMSLIQRFVLFELTL